MARKKSKSPVETLCGALSLLIPLCLYILTGSPASVWLDSGEFLATGFALGSAHPPGHPVYITVVKLFSFIPVGSLAFKGSLASGIAASVACWLCFRLILAISKHIDRGVARWLPPIFALLGALVLAMSRALWIQAVRPEVYSLQLMLALLGIWALVRYGLEKRGNRSGIWIAAAGLAFGLSLANHHFSSLLILPGAIVLFTEDALGKWRRTLKLVLLGGVPAVFSGLLSYLHLFLRSLNTSGAVSLGSSPDLSSFVWVVSARAFQRAMTEPPTTPYFERLIEALFLLFGQLGPITAIVSIGGLYFLVRQKWGIGSLLLLSLLATWMAQSWMGFDPQNPDVLGYLLLPVCVFSVGVARLGPLLITIVPARLTIRVGLATVAAIFLIFNVAHSFFTNWEQCDFSNFRGTEIVADHLFAEIPPKGVVISEHFGSGFNIWTAQVVEGSRPDVSHFHFPFVGFPGYVRQVHARHGDLQGVLREALAHGELSDREISALVQRRPVFVEPMIQSQPTFLTFLLPRGLLWEASAEPLGRTDVRMSIENHFEKWEAVTTQLGDTVREEQTRRMLLWRLYIDALVLARRGERQGASEAVRRALVLAPGTPELERFGQALEEGTGRMDISPFLPANARTRPTDEPQADMNAPDILDF